MKELSIFERVVLISTEQELITQIIEKAWNDPAFKQQLLADPKTAIAEEFDVTIPENIELTVVEETSTSFYLVIPPAPGDQPEGEPNIQW